MKSPQAFLSSVVVLAFSAHAFAEPSPPARAQLLLQRNFPLDLAHSLTLSPIPAPVVKVVDSPSNLALGRYLKSVQTLVDDDFHWDQAFDEGLSSEEGLVSKLFSGNDYVGKDMKLDDYGGWDVIPHSD